MVAVAHAAAPGARVDGLRPGEGARGVVQQPGHQREGVGRAAAQQAAGDAHVEIGAPAVVDGPLEEHALIGGRSLQTRQRCR